MLMLIYGSSSQDGHDASACTIRHFAQQQAEQSLTAGWGGGFESGS